MRRIPIRIKLAAALAVPLIAMGLVTLVEVADTDDSLTQEVYSFLSSFTAGVQRGLEAARADGGTWPGGLTGGAR